MDATRIDALLDRAVGEQVVPGVVAVVGDREGVLYEGAFGRLNVDGDVSAVPDTMMWIASLTKAFVSVAALQLIEQGDLELEQPVADILPAFGGLKVLEGFDGDTPRLRSPKGQATIRHLLTHTAGAGYWFANADVLRYHQLAGIPDPTAGRVAMLEMPLCADPGTRWEYGTNTDWLGQVVEAVSGLDLATYCDERVFGPLGMRDATFAPTDEQIARTMTVHSRTPRRRADTHSDGGAGRRGLLLRRLRRLRNGPGLPALHACAAARRRARRGERPAPRDRGACVHRPPPRRPAARSHTVGDPRSAATTSPPGPWPRAGASGSTFVLEDVPEMRRAGTGDWAGLCNCYFWIDRSTGVAGAILAQVLPFYDARIVETATSFEQAAYAEVSAPATT